MNISSWKRVIKLGQSTGVLSGTGACILWMMAIWFPASEIKLSGVSLIVAFLMILISIIAIIASLKAHGGVLIVLFMISFFPVGLYMLGTGNWYRLIGVFNIGYLIAGVCIKLMLLTSDKINDYQPPGDDAGI